MAEDEESEILMADLMEEDRDTMDESNATPLREKKRRNTKNRHCPGFSAFYVAGVLKYKCNLCQKVLQNTSYKRLISHRNKCDRQNGTCSAEQCPKHVKIEPLVEQEPPTDEDEINEALVEFIQECDLPVSIVENPSFLKLLDKLRPGYVPLLTTELPGYAMHFEASPKQQPQQQQQQPIKKHVLTMVVEEDGHCAEVLTEIVTDGAAGKDFYVSEPSPGQAFSPSSSSLARGKINTDVEVVRHHSCNAYAVNSLMKEICRHSDQEGVLKDVLAVVKEFSGPGLKAKVAALGGAPLHRARGSKEFLELVAQNYATYVALAKDKTSNMSESVREILQKEAFIPKVNELLMDLTPVATALAEIERPGCNLAEAVEQWLNLLEEYNWNPDISEMIERKIEQMDLLSDVALAAYVLDKRFMGLRLTRAQRGAAERFLFSELSGEGISSYTTYLDNDDDCFRALSKRCTPDCDFARKGFWRAARNTHEELSKLALSLEGIPASATQQERSGFKREKN